jgi:excisionase family DNA binding protein
MNPFDQISEQIGTLTSIVLTIKTELIEQKNKQYFNLKEAGDLLGVSEQTIRRNVKKGFLKAHLLGKKMVIPYTEIYDNLNQVKSIKYQR